MIKIKKKWRELAKEERFNIPVKYFNLDEETINDIRNISDIKTRLIKAAKLQYETFRDIHTYLTVWIAGCGSDSIIREKFGNTKNFLSLFSKIPQFPDYIKPSWTDIKKNIKIPDKMSEELAEETGIHIGDGNLNASLTKEGYLSYRYGISGDLTNELIYHKDYISKLLYKLYNIKPNILLRQEKNNVETYCRSKSIVEFKNKFLELPLGSKKLIKIPNLILNDNLFQKKCCVGIIDTDFSITKNLSITGKLNNLEVIKEMAKFFLKNKVEYKLSLYEDYGRFYINKKGANIIIKEWGLKNQKHLSKIKVFEQFNRFIPFTTTSERLALISGDLNLEDLEKISKKRALNFQKPLNRL